MKIITNVKKFQALPASKRRAFVQAFFLLTAVRTALAVLPFRRIKNYFEAPISAATKHKDPKKFVEEARWAIQTAGTILPGGSSCLPQAFSFIFLLRKHAIPGKLKIGVQKDLDDIFSAHAWVELDDKPVLGEKMDQDYKEIFAVGV